MIDAVTGRLRAWAGNGTAIRRAARAAVAVPATFAVASQGIGNAQTATFAAFGAFALLLFVEFPGTRTARLAEFSLLGVVGVILITVGTLLASPDWLAVASMAVIAFIVLFAGAISSVTAAAGRAALLTYILPVMLPGGPHDLPARLLGWALALAVAVPVALFVWPPQEHNRLRVRAAETCRALAGMLRLEQPPPGEGDSLVTLTHAVRDLRAAFRASAARPVALSTGSRLLMQLVDELEWLTTSVVNACADAPETWPRQGRHLRAASADALFACAAVLSHTGSAPARPDGDGLDARIEELDAARRGVSRETLEELRGAIRVGAGGRADTFAPGEFDRPLYAAHELGYVVGLALATVRAITAADARSWFDRLIGRRPEGAALGEASAAERIAAGHLDRNSVWLQNSVRGAAGLAAAVLVARLSQEQEGFWIVLAALSVLRSNALSTGATALRAIVGTVIGFAVGALLVAGIGTDLDVLWALLPIAIFVAGFAPEAISFAAGQAAFTVMVIILFNIIAPSGWRIGVLRVEDIVLGCVASIAAGVLFWPRGAGAALAGTLAQAYRDGAVYLRDSIAYATGRSTVRPDPHESALTSFWRLDDALRQYQSERGAKNVPLEHLTALVNGAGRLRLAGTAVARLRVADTAGNDLAAPSDLLLGQTERVVAWYETLGNVLGGASTILPPVRPASPESSFLDVILPAVDKCGDPARAEQAERLLWSSQYVADVNRMRAELTEPAAAVRATWGEPWWRR